jgi:hypothetical protein
VCERPFLKPYTATPFRLIWSEARGPKEKHTLMRAKSMATFPLSWLTLKHLNHSRSVSASKVAGPSWDGDLSVSTESLSVSSSSSH